MTFMLAAASICATDALERHLVPPGFRGTAFWLPWGGVPPCLLRQFVPGVMRVQLRHRNYNLAHNLFRFTLAAMSVPEALATTTFEPYSGAPIDVLKR